jgi:alkanesulfonate monooxygenase SsuD/methylene tetrahydromethanopterin reductase-like flavin-dependent oxidoreductase (luciferase family)
MTAFQFGYMTRAQYRRDEDIPARFTELMEQVRLAEKLGFVSFVKGQHFSSDPFYEFQQMPLLARAMAEAPTLRLVTGVSLLTLHKPLDIAEQMATLDLMSGGKAVFGCALGYRDVEYKAFGVKRGEGGKRFEENLEAIKQLFTGGPVTMKGSHFELDEARLSVPLIQEGGPPIWIGANADVAIQRAARMGDCWYISAHHRLDTLERQIDLYKRELDAVGKPFPAEMPFRRETFVADSREQAIEMVRPHLGLKYNAYHQWGQDKVMPEGDDDLGQDFDDLMRNRFILGSPDEVAEEIIACHRRLGVNHMIVSLQWPGMPQSMTLEAMHRFAEEVFPRVRAGI